tara:strand:- start:3722 stop:3937 length:216 start_codon:yes stop_codon:yes gene_type:complete
MDRCKRLANPKKRNLKKRLEVLKAMIKRVKAIPDLSAEENKVNTIGVKKIKRKIGLTNNKYGFDLTVISEI